jgi:Spy/CpxP family protein refolding chaperone
MKKIIIALAVVFSISTAAAQDGATKAKADHPKASPEQRAQKTTDRLDKTVALTADQKTQAYKLALTKAKKKDVIREKYKGKPEQKETAKGEMKTARDEYETALKALLTPEQNAKMEEKKAAHKAAAAEHKQKVSPEQRAQRSVNKLDETITLTPDQKTQVYGLALTKTRKMQAIREKYKGQPEQKEAAKKEMKIIHEDYRIALKPILTPEQAAKMEACRKEHHKGGKKLHTKPSVKESGIPANPEGEK